MLKIKQGFTLIELLIVIAIIGSLAAFFINSSYINIRKGRDVKRQSDIAQYRNALEIYAAKNNTLYPSRITGSDRAATTLCGDLGLSLSLCQEDPSHASSATYTYYYESDGAGGGPPAVATKYLLWAKLEVPISGTASYWVMCSNGLSGTKPQAGFNPLQGICPLP